MHSNKQSALVDPREIILAKLSVEQLMSHLSTLQNGGSLPAELFVDVPESAYEYIPVLPRVVTDQQIFQLPPSAAEALHGLNQSRSSDPMNRDQSGKNRSTREANSDALVLSIIPALADVTKFRDHEQVQNICIDLPQVCLLFLELIFVCSDQNETRFVLPSMPRRRNPNQSTTSNQTGAR
jgi:hypothetical protein